MTTESTSVTEDSFFPRDILLGTPLGDSAEALLIEFGHSEYLPRQVIYLGKVGDPAAYTRKYLLHYANFALQTKRRKGQEQLMDLMQINIDVISEDDDDPQVAVLFASHRIGTPQGRLSYEESCRILFREASEILTKCEVGEITGY